MARTLIGKLEKHMPKLARQVLDLQRSRRWINLTAMLALSALVLIQTASASDEDLLQPSADYTPQEVVQVIIDALGENAATQNDAGIATVYRFASPGNRANTGPLSRFTTMIKSGFADMLDHRGSRYDTMEVTGDVAVQAVWLLLPSGQEQGYAFQLGRQSSGEYAGMWMTDAVMPLGTKGEPGTRI